VSASEKLRALEEACRTQTSLNYRRVVALNDLEAALPEIVAAVAAANTAAASLHLDEHVGDVFQLSAALRALDEKLP
jgi:hypothetical protein